MTRSHQSVPFLLVGGFGTGKTRTLAEMLIQVKNFYKFFGLLKWRYFFFCFLLCCLVTSQLVNQSDTKVLFCASTNLSADRVLSRIWEQLTAEVNLNSLFPPIFFFELVFFFSQSFHSMKDVLRLNSCYRNYDNVATYARKFSIYDAEKRIFVIPNVENLKKFKLIVTTCYDSCNLFSKKKKFYFV